MSFIFGGDTGMTYEQVQRNRKIAEQLMAGSGRSKNVGEGIGSFAKQISGALIQRKADKRDDALRSESEDLWGTTFGGGFGGGSTPSPYSAAPPSVSTAPLPTEGDLLGNDAMAAIGRTPNNPAMPASGTSEGERLALARTLQAEAGNQGFEGMLDVGSVIANRRNSGQWGDTFTDVVTAPGQFSAWNSVTGYAGGEQGQPMDFAPGAEALRAADLILAGNYEDQTGGAQNYFAEIPGVSPRPSWADESFVQRGDHYFGTAGGGGGRANPRGQGGGQPNVSTQQIVELLSNPYIRQDPAKSAVLQSLLQQNMQGQDPMRALEMERAQLELEALRNPQPKDSPNSVREYQFYEQQERAQGREPLPYGQWSVMDEAAGVAGAGPSLLGTSGLVAVPDPDAEGGVRVIAAEGSPIALEQAAEASAAETERTTKIDKASSGIGLITSIMDDPALAGITGMVQGSIPPMTQAGTDLNVKIEQLQGQAFLQAFESLKGGGSITAIEGDKATAAMARLNRVQGTPAYLEALAEIRYVMQRAKQRAEGGDPGQYNFEWPPKETPAGVPDADGWITLPNGVRVRERS